MAGETRRLWVWPLLVVLVWLLVGGPSGSFAGAGAVLRRGPVDRWPSKLARESDHADPETETMLRG